MVDNKIKVLVAQSCLTLCSPMDCSVLWPPTRQTPLHGVLQLRILEWVAMPFSRGSSWPRGWTWVSCIAGGFFPVCASRELFFGNVSVWFWHQGYGGFRRVEGFSSWICYFKVTVWFLSLSVWENLPVKPSWSDFFSFVCEKFKNYRFNLFSM